MLKARKGLRPKRCVIRCRDTAARHTTDDVKFVKQADVATLPLHPGLTQRIKHPIAERRSPSATTREADKHQHRALTAGGDVWHDRFSYRSGTERLVLPGPHGRTGTEQQQHEQRHCAIHVTNPRISVSPHRSYLRQNCGTNRTITASNSRRPISMPMVQTQV